VRVEYAGNMLTEYPIAAFEPKSTDSSQEVNPAPFSPRK